jgi:hypothetical protein
MGLSLRVLKSSEDNVSWVARFSEVHLDELSHGVP